MFKECLHTEPPPQAPHMIVSAEVAKQGTTDFQADKAPILNHAINKLDHIGYSFTAEALGKLIVESDKVVPIQYDVSYKTTLAIHVDCLAQYSPEHIPEIFDKLVLPRHSVYKTMIDQTGALELVSNSTAYETDPPGYDADTKIPCPPASCELTPSLPLP